MEHFPAMANDPLYNLSPALLIEHIFVLNIGEECVITFQSVCRRGCPIHPRNPHSRAY